MAENSTFGVDNIALNNSTSSGVGIDELTSRTSRVVVDNTFGSWELFGVAFLLIIGFSMQKLNVEPDVTVAALAPAVFFLSMEGLLPGPESFGVAAILTVSTLFIAGLVSFLR